MALALGVNSINKAYLGTTEIQKMYLGSSLVFDNSIQPSELTPIMTNFRVENDTPNRITFDTPLGPVTGLTIQGFDMVGKSGSIINVGANYLELSTTINWIDNIMIKLVNGDGTVYDFTLEEIVNNVAQPTGTPKYVTTSGGNGAGTIGDPWSLIYASATAQAGDTVWIEKGDYGNTILNPANVGTITDPIQFIGYTASEGDITTPMVDSFVYVDNAQATAFVDDTIYPVINGTQGTSSTGISANRNYVIYKNICVLGKEYGINVADGVNGNIFENCLAGNSFRANSAYGRGIQSGKTSAYIRVTNCISFDAALNCANIQGTSCKIEGTKTASGDFVSTDSGTDYHITTNKLVDSSVVRSEARRVISKGHLGHGIGGKAYPTGTPITDCLWADNYAENMQDESLFIAYPDAYDNVFKRNISIGNARSTTNCKHISIRDGSDNNVFDSNDLRTGGAVIYLADTSEEGNNGVPQNNIIKNNIGENCSYVYYALSVYGNGETYGGNKIYNNTFDNNGPLFRCNATDDGTNELKNNIVRGSSTHYSANGITDTISEQYNNYWNFWGSNGTPPSGTGNISVDPQFTNTTDYVPQNDALIVAPRLTGVEMDINDDERLETTTIGAVKNPNEIIEDPSPPIGDYDYYVSANGTGDGLSEGSPMSYASAQSIIPSLTVGQSMAFKGGDTFNGTLNIGTKTGTAGNLIEFVSYGTGQAEINGTTAQSSWTSEGSNIYSSNQASAVYQVFENETRLRNQTSQKFEITTVVNTTTFTCSALVGYHDIVGASILCTGNVYTVSTREVIAFDSGTGQVTLESAPSIALNTNNGGFWILNDLNGLDTLGDWVYTSGKVYLNAASTPTNIYASTGEGNGIVLSGASYVKVDNLKVFGFNQYGISMNSSNNVEVTNNTLDYCYISGISAFGGDGFLNNKINGNTINGTANNGIYMTFGSSEINSNTITNIGEEGIHTYYNAAPGFGMRVDGNDCDVMYNTLSGMGYNGIAFAGFNTMIKYNYLDDFCNFLIDGGAIYTYSGEWTTPTATGSEVMYNTIIGDGSIAGSASGGVYLDGRTDGVTVKYNNIAWSNPGVYININRDVDASENNLYRCKQGIRITEQTDGEVSGNTVNLNNIYNADNGQNINPLALLGSYDMYTGDNNIYWNDGKLNQINISSTGTRDYTLADYKVNSGLEASSISNTTVKETHTVDSYNTANSILNGDISSGTTGWAGNGCSIADSGGYLSVTNVNNGSYLQQNSTLSSVTDGLWYEVSLDVKGSSGQPLGWKLQKISGDFANTFERYIINPTTEWVSHKFYVEMTFTTDDCRLTIHSKNDSNDFEIDNISLRQVTLGDWPELSMFAYNETDTAKDITLPTGTWIDIRDNTEYDGSINIQPYASSILLLESDAPPTNELLRDPGLDDPAEWEKITE